MTSRNHKAEVSDGTRHKHAERHSVRRIGRTEERDVRPNEGAGGSETVGTDHRNSQSGNGVSQDTTQSGEGRQESCSGVDGPRQSCRACGRKLAVTTNRAPRRPNPSKRRTGHPVGAPAKHIEGIDVLCPTCTSEARFYGSVERFLAKSLKNASSMVDALPALHGTPPSLSEIRAMSEDDAWMVVRKMRWPNANGEPSCPKCGHGKCYTIAKRKVFHCASPDCKFSFSALTGTVFSSPKKGYKGMLTMMAYDGPINHGPMEGKTALNWRRRMDANRGRMKGTE